MTKQGTSEEERGREETPDLYQRVYEPRPPLTHPPPHLLRNLTWSNAVRRRGIIHSRYADQDVAPSELPSLPESWTFNLGSSRERRCRYVREEKNVEEDRESLQRD